MVSDVLSDAVESINEYMADPDLYTDPTARAWIMSVIESMTRLREFLGTPPFMLSERYGGAEDEPKPCKACSNPLPHEVGGDGCGLST